MLRVMISHVAPCRAAAAAAASAETLVAVANGFGAVMRHSVRARRRVAVLGDGLSDLIAIGLRLRPRVARAQQCYSNCNEDPCHLDCFLSNQD
jgi:hypothetical protein